MLFAKKSSFFFSILILISFCAAFFGSSLWKDFIDINWLNLKTWKLFLAFINVKLGWSLYLSRIFKIGPCSDESWHFYPLLGIFKIGIFIKYSLNLVAIWAFREIILSSSTKLILEYFEAFSEKVWKFSKILFY